MKIFQLLLWGGLVLCAPSLMSGQAAMPGTNAVPAKSVSLPRVAILDIRSKDIAGETVIMLSDILRTELFKLHVFQIMERSMIQKIIEEKKFEMTGFVKDNDLLQIGRMLGVEKLIVMTIGMMNKNIAINIRVINMDKATVDFSENIFISSRDAIVDAIKDIAKKIEVYYVLKDDSGTGNKKELLKRKWIMLGAAPDQAEFLVTLQSEPDKYLEIRQYDISYTIDDFIKTLKNGWEPSIIMSFFKEGISYQNIIKSLSLGVSDLSLYRSTFKDKGYSFDDYLLAYENRIYNVDEFRKFKDGYRRDRFVLGVGGAADSFPIANATTKFLIVQLGWEHFWSRYQRNLFKHSMEMGFNLLNGFLPTPYFQYNAYFGAPPFYGKVGLGFLSEVFVGGHIGGYVRLGIEVLEVIEFNIVIVPFGTDPGVSYVDGTPKGQPGYIPINFPYFGAFLAYKI